MSSGEIPCLRASVTLVLHFFHWPTDAVQQYLPGKGVIFQEGTETAYQFQVLCYKKYENIDHIVSVYLHSTLNQVCSFAPQNLVKRQKSCSSRAHSKICSAACGPAIKSGSLLVWSQGCFLNSNAKWMPTRLQPAAMERIHTTMFPWSKWHLQSWQVANLKSDDHVHGLAMLQQEGIAIINNKFKFQDEAALLSACNWGEVRAE